MAFLAVVACGALFTQVFRVEVKHQSFRAGATGSAETLYLPPHLALRFAALGHEPFLADMLFVRAYAYVLTHLFTDRIFTWLDTYAEAMLALDPENPRAYRWASQMVMYGQQITNESIRKSNYYAKRGMEQFPNDWRFYMDVGFNLYFEYKFADDEEKRVLQEEALQYFTVAASLPNSELDPNFVTELYMRKNDTRMALFQAYRAYQDASERERKFLLRRIAQLESDEAARSLRAFEEAWRAELPFVPMELFALVGSGGPRLPRSWVEAVGWAGAVPSEGEGVP